MKNKLIITGALAAVLCMGAQADLSVTIDSGQMTNGYMNVFNLPADGGGFQFGGPWGIADLTATFGSASQVTMSPNTIGDPDPYWYIGGGAPGNPGNKIMEANLYAQVDDVLAGQNVTFQGVVSAVSLTSAHQAIAFIKDFAPDFSSFNESTVALDSTGAFNINLATDPGAGRHVQWGLQMTGENVWTTDVGPFGSVTVDAIPEPATLGLIGIFGGGLLMFRRHFKI